MYGGLFGDLPSAKKDEESKDEKTKKVQEPPASAIVNNTKAVVSTSETKKKQPSSVLSGLGNAGTSMAFVPTALRPRKRPKSNVKVKIAQAKVVVRPKIVTASMPQKQQEESKQETVVKSEVAPTIKIENGKVEEKFHTNENRKEEVVIPPTYVKEEEKEFQLDSIIDPYDPFAPNDLLMYWERKKVEEKRLKLEKETQETLKRQQIMRQKLEQERQKIEKSGSANAIIEHRAKTALNSGRGRRMNNLPAWLLKKQQEELASSTSPSAEDCTVILSNLTAPNDIDDDLADEVQEECEEQCGPVESVRVQDASPPYELEVKAFIKFRSSKSAEKAEKLFHGRMFGTRRITAKRIKN